MIRIDITHSVDTELVYLTAVSGRTLSRAYGVPVVTITRREWLSAPSDAYDKAVEATWAMRACGLAPPFGDTQDQEVPMCSDNRTRGGGL